MTTISDIINQLYVVQQDYGDLEVCQLMYLNPDYSDIPEKSSILFQVLPDPLDPYQSILIID